PLLRVLVGQLQADRRRLEHRLVTIDQRRNVAERVQLEVLGRTVLALLRIQAGELVGNSELFQEPARASGTGSRNEVELHVDVFFSKRREIAMAKVKAVLIGGTGYGGAEILRRLLFHPQVEVP